MRETIEELGGWPSAVSKKLDNEPSFDCGVTRYFIVVLQDDVFKQTWNFLIEKFDQRTYREKTKITEIKIKDIASLESQDEMPLRREVADLFVMMREARLLDGRVCAWLESNNKIGLKTGAQAGASTGESWTATSTATTIATDFNNKTTVEEVPRPVYVRHVSRKYACRYCAYEFVQLRSCWECSSWNCQKCSFWCTTCPKGYRKYTVCRECYEGGAFLLQRGKIWRCRSCQNEDR